MADYWIPPETDSDVVTPICECGGLVLDGACVLCGKAETPAIQEAELYFENCSIPLIELFEG